MFWFRFVTVIRMVICMVILYGYDSGVFKKTLKDPLTSGLHLLLQSCADTLTCSEILEAEAGCLIRSLLDTVSPKET